MADTLQKKKDALYAGVLGAINAAFPGLDPSFIVETPKEKGHGDFATNAAMALAKPLKQPPRAIAQSIIEKLDLKALGAEKAEIAGPGFINFHLDKSYLCGALREIEREGDHYGRVAVGGGKKVMIEFVSANPTGPMHMGNARGGALGDLLANVLTAAGYDVTKEFYINDAGAQIEKLGRSLEARYIQLLKGENAARLPEDGYQGEDIAERAADYIALYGDSLLEKSAQERQGALAQYALEHNIEGIKKTLASYGIDYDVWFRESALYESGEVGETMDLLRKNNITYEKDGALWMRAAGGAGDAKDEVLIRQNGIPTYFAADIAYHRNKFLKRGFDICIDIWGADHHGHIARMKGAMEALGIDSGRLVVLVIQLVRLMQDGEIVRMSKRTGKMITLNDLIEDIGTDAARFFFNMRAAGSHMDFDLDLAIEQSSENPVFYVQYAHARICSILRLLADEGVAVPACAEADFSLLTKEEEFDLLRKLAELPDEVRAAAQSFEPSRLTRYLLDLSALFHSFYNVCRIRGEAPALMAARLKLADSTRIVIKNVLSLLGVSAPEKM